MSFLYRSLTRVLRRVGPVLAPEGSKLRRGLEGRADAHERLGVWGEEHRDTGRPLAWFHAPSVGEGLQAEAVIEALRARRPDIQIVFTHFSPSAEGLARRLAVDLATYLPWDLPEAVGAAMDGVWPDLLVFTKTEVWPELVAEARRRDIPVGLVGASVPPGSGRARWPARALLAPAWRGLSLACAIGESDADGLRRLGVSSGVVHTTGDPGIDSALRRAGDADRTAPHLAPFGASSAPTVVAGSTWPPGEDVLLPALVRVRDAVPGLRVIIAPHEPTEAHVSGLLARLTGDGWSPTVLGEVVRSGAVGDADVVVVDSVGVLADLYTVGDVAYVGGGFHDAGLHSVLEPAAARLPVVFGPRHTNAAAAAELVEVGGAKIASDTGEMARVLAGWLTEPSEKESASRRAFGYIDEHRGAADRTGALLETLI